MKQTKAHLFRSHFQKVTSLLEFNMRVISCKLSSKRNVYCLISLLCNQIVAELLGTYILIFVGCGSILVNQFEKITIVGIALVWGLAVMALVYALGHVSGAHFNPAVTIAFAASRKLPWKQVRHYLVLKNSFICYFLPFFTFEVSTFLF